MPFHFKFIRRNQQYCFIHISNVRSEVQKVDLIKRTKMMLYICYYKTRVKCVVLALCYIWLRTNYVSRFLLKPTLPWLLSPPATHLTHNQGQRGCAKNGKAQNEELCVLPVTVDFAGMEGFPNKWLRFSSAQGKMTKWKCILRLKTEEKEVHHKVESNCDCWWTQLWLSYFPPFCISRPDSFARADQGPVQIQHQDQDPPAAHREQRRPALAEGDEEGQGVLRHLRLLVPDVRRRPQAGAWRKTPHKKKVCFFCCKSRKKNKQKRQPIKKSN